MTHEAIWRVSPVYYDHPQKFADRSGYRYICPTCDWRSPVMRWPLGAIRHLNEHECATEAVGVSGARTRSAESD